MVRRDGAAVRKQRIEEIGRFIMSNLAMNREIPLSKTLALLQYKTGLTKEKLMEYIGILQDLERFTIDIEKDKIRSISES